MPVTAVDVLQYFEDLSNWGRWGEEDEKGAVNLITPQKRVDAAALVSEGATISCALPMNAPESRIGKVPFLHYMGESGERFALEGQVGGAFQYATDFVAFTIHGTQYTHLDALSHVFWKGRSYNDRPAELVSAAGGASKNGVEAFSDGIVSRGVLLDFSQLRDMRGRHKREIITLEDVLRVERLAGVTVSAGDILLHRTGVEVLGNVGFHPEILPWLHERGVAVFGGDTAQDPRVPVFDEVRHPIHQVAMAAMGIPMLDNADVAQLASACADYSRWEFHLSILPLPIYSATGSPVNPVATF